MLSYKYRTNNNFKKLFIFDIVGVYNLSCKVSCVYTPWMAEMNRNTSIGAKGLWE
jgi:hypothetical protein